MKKLALPLFIICCLFFAACAKKPKETKDLWFQNESFLKSVQLSDAEGASGIILTTNIDLNAPDEEGRTALHYAILNSHNEDLISAIASAPSINLAAKDNLGYDALTLAATANFNENVLLALFMAGAKPENPDELLDQAYKNNNLEISRIVGRYLMKTPWDTSKTFLDALQNEDYKTLLRELPFTDIKNPSKPQKATPLYIAIMGVNKNIIPLLVKYGADVNEFVVPEQKVTPLHYAAASRPLTIIDALIKAGAEINATDGAGLTPLMAAAKMHPYAAAAASLLIKNGADINIQDGDGNTALSIAARHNQNPEIIAVLTQAGADIEHKNKKGETPLILAAAFNKNEAVADALILQKANINALNNDGFTALAAAASLNENEKVLQTILSFGADINVKTPQGFTPLMLAVTTNPNEKTAIFLVNAGADIGDAKTLEQFAQKNKNPKMAEFIKTLLPEEIKPKENSKSVKAWYNNDKFSDAVEKGDVKALRTVLGGGVNITALYYGDRSITALMYAVAHTQNEEIITALIKAGADPAATNQSGDSAMMVAALVSKNPKIITALVQGGADINAKDNTGLTPLMAAAANNPSLDIIRTFINSGADTKNIGGLLEAAGKNKNPEIKEFLQKIH